MATEITPKLDTIKVYDSYFFEGGGILSENFFMD